MSDVFQGELMTCVVCRAERQSSPDVESNWHLIELDGEGYYACPDEFPPDEVGRKEDFKKAYLLVAEVFPQTWYDRLSMLGIKAEVWMMPETPLIEGKPPQASFYHSKDREGRVALVLGVGNVSPVVVADFMHKLFVERQVVVLKPSSVNEYIGPLIEKGFGGLIKRGFMRVVFGGAEEGTYLVQHPLVDEIHMTGSERTFENIVFGPGEEGAKRKAERRPKITRSITAELGNISPVIIVPGPWDKSDIEAQADKLVSWLSTNAGYGCLTPRMIINWQRWDRREK